MKINGFYLPSSTGPFPTFQCFDFSTSIFHRLGSLGTRLSTPYPPSVLANCFLLTCPHQFWKHWCSSFTFSFVSLTSASSSCLTSSILVATLCLSLSTNLSASITALSLSSPAVGGSSAIKLCSKTSCFVSLSLSLTSFL